ncbi:MAG: precorrin-6y C5,15-methyltransferase (decarboxylating) subunit CbiE [Actinomycetota bacterium]|nr:precorrin-6y C5,15-methyltransferase (decarboxylating) subunit CbiE [Actinomycetota bacterium]
MPESVILIGVLGSRLGDLPAARLRDIAEAPVVLGSSRLRSEVLALNPHFVQIAPRMQETLEKTDLSGGAVVLTSGDPGFFGATRLLAAIVGSENLRIHPGPSSASVAFARIGLPWDDAVVVSAHGRSLDDAVAAAGLSPKVAYLLSPENTAQRLAAELSRLGRGDDTMVVAERLGDDDERITTATVAEIATGSYDPLAVGIVLKAGGHPVPPRKGLSFGAGERHFAHRDAMITKAELRAVVLSKLELPEKGRLLDIGAGSGSVGIEAATLQPALEVVAIESSPGAIALIRENAARFGAGITIASGKAEELIAAYAPFERAFVGGGGLDVLRMAATNCSAGGVVVATFASLDRAAEATSLLGSLVEVSVARGVRLPDGGVRLKAENPTFVVWGRIP